MTLPVRRRCLAFDSRREGVTARYDLQGIDGDRGDLAAGMAASIKFFLRRCSQQPVWQVSSQRREYA